MVTAIERLYAALDELSAHIEQVAEATVVDAGERWVLIEPEERMAGAPPAGRESPLGATRAEW